MSSIATSNEIDLDWLARNRLDWPDGLKAVPNPIRFVLDVMLGEKHFTRDQWLARRAELQNKPSWKDAPEWAQFLGQDEDGVWYWHGERPNEKGEDVNGQRYWMSRGISDISCRGELLGDWRDTLESRPEELKPSIEEANMLAQEFKQFTSIEDNQGQEMKHDNGWFERGELPPVGCLCLYAVSDRLSAEVEITAHAKLGLCFVGVGKSGESYVSKTAELHRFRPIRTERDDLIEIISSSMLVTTEQVADAIIAAGFKMGGK